MYDALTKYNSTSYIDSSGNKLTMVLETESVEVGETSELGQCTNADYKVEYKKATWRQFPDFGMSMEYDGNRHTSWSTQRFYIFQNNRTDMIFLSLDPPAFGRWDTISTLIQGVNYSDVLRYSNSDTGASPSFEFIFSMDEGLLLMSVQGEYRWERLPD